MFEFNNEVVNRDWFSFKWVAIDGWKFIYKTKNKEEIKVLERNGFTNKIVKKDKKAEETTKKTKNESNK